MTRGRKGCWTCRLRHRKCDEAVPACRECSTRSLECHGYDPRAPEWMDDPQRVEEELQRIKVAVKENYRRVRLDRSRQAAVPLGHTCRCEHTQPSPAHETLAAREGDLSAPASTRNSTFREAQHLMHYIDFIFRLQYPYYVNVPDPGEGRAWLFWLLTQSAPLRHAALTLSAYHQHTISQYRTEHQEAELLRYYSQALKELQKVLSSNAGDQFKISREARVEVVVAGIFLISFEIFRGGTDNWETHLNAIISIVSELTPSMLAPHSPNTQSPDFDFIRGMRTAEEFMIVNVVWFDLFSCVSRTGAPKTRYHQWLEPGQVDMARIMGCQNSMMLIIGDIASLEAEAPFLGLQSLRRSIIELEKRIHQHLEALESNTELPSTSRSVTRLHATAALVQLHTIGAESYLTAPKLRNAVSRVIENLQRTDKDISIRGVPWVLCIAGSVALPAEQPIFEGILTDVLDHTTSGFTNCGTVLRIIKHAWGQQYRYPDQLWTARRAMADMGISALLL